MPVALATALLALAGASCGGSRGPQRTASPALAPDIAPADPFPGPTSTSRPLGAEPLIAQTTPPAIARLALRYQPTVKMSVADRFWPVSVASVLRETAARRTCLVAGGRCVAQPPALADLKPGGSRRDYLDYAAPLDDRRLQVDDAQTHFEAFERGLGVDPSVIAAWPANPNAIDPYPSAQIYFYYAGRAPYRGYYPGIPPGLVSLQYWFFYPLNYYPTLVNPLAILSRPVRAVLNNSDYHEGDWEHIAVLLDPTTGRPRYLWMARHDREGVGIPWSESSGDHGHPIIYPALGGHPSYDTCGGHRRRKLLYLLSDYVVCGGPGLFTFGYAATPLVDLSYAPWACWPGHFGTAAPGLIPTSNSDLEHLVLVAGPASPLRQQENSTVCTRTP